MEGPYEKGMRVRREVLGDAHVDQAVAATTKLDESFQRWITESVWGTLWANPDLDRKTRSLVTLAILTALVRPNQLRGHVRGALANGATPEEIREVLLHTVDYAGIPAGVEAFAAAAEVLKERRP